MATFELEGVLLGIAFFIPEMHKKPNKSFLNRLNGHKIPLISMNLRNFERVTGLTQLATFMVSLYIPSS